MDGFSCKLSAVPRRGRPRKPVVDGFAQALVGHWHDRDGGGAGAVEGAQVGEQVGGRLHQVAGAATG